MPDLRLVEVAPADVGDRPVVGFTSFPELAPFSTGDGALDVLCARCSFVLMAGAAPDDVHAGPLLIRCPSCGTVNQPPA